MPPGSALFLQLRVQAAPYHHPSCVLFRTCNTGPAGVVSGAMLLRFRLATNSMAHNRLVAPAGTPVDPRELLNALRCAALSQYNPTLLEQTMSPLVGDGRQFYFNTGRSALAVMGRALHRYLAQSGKNDLQSEVILPGYTCYSVPASLLRAGLRLRVCDVDPATLDYCPQALERLDTSRAFAIVSSNLYGLPNDLPALTAFAKERSLLVIDDAAQSLGARIGGGPSGSFGAAGLFSFDKGKVVTSIQGGVLVVRDPTLEKLLSEEYEKTRRPHRLQVGLDLAKFIVYALMLPPNRYWLTQQLPFLGLGITRYETDFPITRYSARLSGLVLTLLKKLPALQQARCENARRWTLTLSDTELTPLQTPLSAKPAWTRYPVLAKDAERRDRIISQLLDIGIGASRSYPNSLVDVPELQSALSDSADTPGAREVSERLLTLPTHPYLQCQDLDRAREVLAWQSRR
ncbi:MAG: DegT/DnrJ/EryC1/StrS family aminotransferase [Pseudomonadales bacterium]